MIKKKFPVVSIILYVLAGLLLIFSIWSAVYSFDYISTMIAQNQLITDGNQFEIISFHMSNFGQYILYTAILFALGWIIQVISIQKADMVHEENEEDATLEMHTDVIDEDQNLPLETEDTAEV